MLKIDSAISNRSHPN